MSDTTTGPTEDLEAQTRGVSPCAVRPKSAVRSVQKIAGRTAIVAWVFAMLGTGVFRSVNDIVFALVAVGAVAFVATFTVRAWLDICSGKPDLPKDSWRRDSAVVAALLAFVCLWGVCVITVGIGGALALWASLFNL